ncbi:MULTISPECIES: imm11 family protein [Flagellimonas]|uniref:Immunity MXAN-0049 protein domain-containing protein n=2 Tax=Flagellimonas TaxID=444459 RepID=G2PQ74_ALLRU|nr:MULTISPECIES: DUF1629 domain-containing protein [Allomuricauda]AEM71580.1 hypothetical protein Murru_2544 [Allomuricauda ruestringensis DSM 13258]MBW8201230.1 DUF1629 domain-containing protein [Allomuricauda abyssi]
MIILKTYSILVFMKYSKFSHSTEISQIGIFPQCELSRNVNPRAPDGIYNVPYNEFPDFIPRVEFDLAPKAKWTDIMTSGALSHGYIVSERVKEIFEKHNLPSHAFYPAKIHSGDLSKDYYWFHFFNNDFWNWVDREKSELYLRSIFPEERDDIIMEANLKKDNEGFMEMARNKPSLTDYYWEKLVFNESFPDLDIFTTLSPSMHDVISNRLLTGLEDVGITGYEVKDFCIEESNLRL